MLMMLLLACKEPGLLSAITVQLSEGTTTEAMPAIGMGAATSALVAEICPLVDGVNGYTFEGLGAQALNIETFMAEATDTASRITFPSAGTLDHPGNLVISTDANRLSWAFTWHGEDGSLFEGSFTASSCSVDSVVLAGGGSYTSATPVLGTVALSGQGGLGFSPTELGLPTSGQIRWSIPDSTDTVLLDPAESVDVSSGIWTGVASGSGWSVPVELMFP